MNDVVLVEFALKVVDDIAASSHVGRDEDVGPIVRLFGSSFSSPTLSLPKFLLTLLHYLTFKSINQNYS